MTRKKKEQEQEKEEEENGIQTKCCVSEPDLWP